MSTAAVTSRKQSLSTAGAPLAHRKASDSRQDERRSTAAAAGSRAPTPQLALCRRRPPLHRRAVPFRAAEGTAGFRVQMLAC